MFPRMISQSVRWGFSIVETKILVGFGVRERNSLPTEMERQENGVICKCQLYNQWTW
jgi:hypothetical protein